MKPFLLAAAAAAALTGAVLAVPDAPKPNTAPAPRAAAPKFTAPNFNDRFEVLVCTTQRPVRVRVTALQEGKSVGELWRDRLLKAFTFCDRDNDGVLNEKECGYAFSDQGLTQLLGNGFYQTGSAAPTLKALDQDGDAKVTVEEFVAYYRLSAAQVPRLALKWAFAFPNGQSAYAQPAVAGGRVFVGSDNGFVYALDAASGCVFWSFRASAAVRTAISVGPVGARTAIYFGDLKGNVYAVDATSGAQIWTKHTDDHPLARITGAPTLVAGRLYVPVASLEEGTGGNPNYECCTFRGALVVYDAASGDEVWKAYTIAEPAKPTKKNSKGVQQYGPAGAAVWSAPTVDLKRNAVYVATGDAYTEPAADTSDAIMAFDIRNGRRLWAKQFTKGDAYLVSCAPGRDNCPEVSGPDFDFGNSAILRNVAGGRSVLIAGQKSGAVWAVDPDNLGEIVWQRKVSPGSALGGLEWGSAADDGVGYFPVADGQIPAPAAGGGSGAAPAPAPQAGSLFALRLATGEPLWQVPSPAPVCAPGAQRCLATRSAAITVIPGVVFSGTTDGVLRAYATADGKQLWEYNTAHEYTTVNGVPGKGGSINGPGPVVAGGMLYTNSGYAYLGFGAPGNVLLAFAAQ